MISAEMAADNWPLMEKARCFAERAPSMGVHTHLVRKICVQAAKRFGLKLASPVPSTCGRPECFLSDPFRWCAQPGLALAAIPQSCQIPAALSGCQKLSLFLS